MLSFAPVALLALASSVAGLGLPNQGLTPITNQVPQALNNLTSSILNQTGVISVTGLDGAVSYIANKAGRNGRFALTTNLAAALAVNLPSKVCLLLPSSFAINAPTTASNVSDPFLAVGGRGASPNSIFGLSGFNSAFTGANQPPQLTQNTVNRKFASETQWSIDCNTFVLTGLWTGVANGPTLPLTAYRTARTFERDTTINGESSSCNTEIESSVSSITKFTTNYPMVVAAGNKVVDSTTSAYSTFFQYCSDWWHANEESSASSIYENNESQYTTKHYRLTTSTEQLTLTFVPGTTLIPTVY